jgi:hypothetical protein
VGSTPVAGTSGDGVAGRYVAGEWLLVFESALWLRTKIVIITYSTCQIMSKYGSHYYHEMITVVGHTHAQ